MTKRLGILVSHPIQYYSPWFRYLAKHRNIEVFYAFRQDAKGQAKAGFGVEFDWDVPVLEGYPYRFLKNISKRPGVHGFFGCDTPEISKIIEKDSFDAFLVLGWNKKSYLQAIQACRRHQIPILMRGDSQLAGEREWFKRILKFFPYRYLLPRINAHLYVGNRNREYLKHYGVPEERLFFSPHFIDNDFFQKNSEKAECDGKTKTLRRELKIPEKAFVFIFVGKFIPKKRPLDFIQAGLRLLKTSEDRDFHFLLVGEGPLRCSLESSAVAHADRFHFAGFRNQSELPVYYRASNALILSSARETWGLVVNEAFACGVPAIVSDATGSSADLIDEGKSGFAFPSGNVEILSQKMQAMWRLHRQNPQAIADAVSLKTKNYSMEAATAGLEKALSKVCP